MVIYHKSNISLKTFVTAFQLRYNKYLNQHSHYIKVGSKWPQPSGFLAKVRELKLLDSYPKFEEWILTGKPSPKHMNWLHETWMTSGLTRRMMSDAQRIRVGHWLTIFFQFTTFKQNRPLVSGNFLIRTVFVYSTKNNIQTYNIFRLKQC